METEELSEATLIRLDDRDRAVLREAARALLESDEDVTPTRCAYLAGRLDGLAGRIPADLESPN